MLREKETRERITAPVHITYSNFKENQKIDGYHEDIKEHSFEYSVKLMKYDTRFGTLQLGYNPQKGESFIFANIKTSIFDSASSRFQREMREYEMMRTLKKGTQNRAFSAKRRADSSVMIYKADTKPWSAATVSAYLGKQNLGTLSKTMPFLHLEEEYEVIEKTSSDLREMQDLLKNALEMQDYGEMAVIRANALKSSVEKQTAQALILQKGIRKQNFFRRLNFALDTQKHEMYDYYRDKKRAAEKPKYSSGDIAPPKRDDENEK